MMGWCRMTKQQFLVILCMLIISQNDYAVAQSDDDDDDFTPTVFSPGADVQLAHKYPHLSTSLQEQDRTFFSNEESTADYAISLVMFPALVSGICLICVCCLSLCLCFRCFLLGCLNCFQFISLLFPKRSYQQSKLVKGNFQEKRQKRYAIYSITFPFLLVCSFVAIVWVWVGADHLNNGVNETQKALSFFGDIAQSISDKLSEMTVSGGRIDAFLSNHTCPPEVASYLEDIKENFEDFTNTTREAARITSSVQPVVDVANKNIEEAWNEFQELAFDFTATMLFFVLCIYSVGVCMKTAILMRLGLLLTIIFSFILCVLVFIEMVVVMGYSDFCMAPTHHMERSLEGFAYSVVHYYSTCQGDGPLYRPIEDSQLYNSLMNTTYIEMITDYPNLNEECEEGAATMEASFREISISALDIVEFARCPYIHKIYSHVMLEGFCSDSYSGFYHVHVSHLSTLVIFFALMVNAALLYPYYKGQTLQRFLGCFSICLCCDDKVVDDVHMLEYVMIEHRNPENDDEEAATGGNVELVHISPIATVDADALTKQQRKLMNEIKPHVFAFGRTADVLPAAPIQNVEDGPLNTVAPHALDSIKTVAPMKSFPESIFSFVDNKFKVPSVAGVVRVAPEGDADT